MIGAGITEATPLITAVSFERPEIARFLLEFKETNVNQRCTGDKTAIHFAATRSSEILKLLLAHPKIDVNVMDDVSIISVIFFY